MPFVFPCPAELCYFSLSKTFLRLDTDCLLLFTFLSHLAEDTASLFFPRIVIYFLHSLPSTAHYAADAGLSIAPNLPGPRGDFRLFSIYILPSFAFSLALALQLDISGRSPGNLARSPVITQPQQQRGARQQSLTPSRASPDDHLLLFSFST